MSLLLSAFFATLSIAITLYAGRTYTASLGGAGVLDGEGRF